MSPDVNVEIRAYVKIVNEFTPPSLCQNTIHIWHRDLGLDDSDSRTFWEVLAQDERLRAQRFRFESDRKAYISTRGTLRVLLASYLRKSPADVGLSYSIYGKPSLLRSSTAHDLRFNISHAQGKAVFAFALGMELGIDIERIVPHVGLLELADRFFSECERSSLRELPLEQRTNSFYRCWTRKEAYIKARGDGLAIPLDKFDVGVAFHQGPVLVMTTLNINDASRWAVEDLSIEEGYASAVAWEQRDSLSNVTVGAGSCR